jgi:molybdate transport system substrate-binding protein
MKAIVNIILLSVLLHSCTQKQDEVTIIAASDLSSVMPEIIQKFKSKSKIIVIYASSGKAYTKIRNGAPYDLFFSADIMYPKKLKYEGYTLTEPQLYGIGRLVLWSSKLPLQGNGFSIFYKNPNVRIAIANPEHAPYGKRAIEVLKRIKVYNIIEKQLIIGENISQASQFCITGNADVGILALSIALSPKMKEKGEFVLISDTLYSPLKQAFVCLKHAQNNQTVTDFVNFISSPDVRTIFEKYGFIIP